MGLIERLFGKKEEKRGPVKTDILEFRWEDYEDEHGLDRASYWLVRNQKALREYENNIESWKKDLDEQEEMVVSSDASMEDREKSLEAIERERELIGWMEEDLARKKDVFVMRARELRDRFDVKKAKMKRS